MRVLLSTSIASTSAAHGGPVIARRHAEALVRLGVEVRMAAPEAGAISAKSAVHVEIYETTPASPNALFHDRRPDEVATASLARIMDRFRPDVLYDVHGPAWAIDAAERKDLPCVSMIGDYNWFCRRSFLLDSRLRRCTGPQGREKCFACMNNEYRLRRRIVQQALKQARMMGIAAGWPPIRKLDPYRLWDALEEAHQFIRRLRSGVARFIVGDRKAQTFFLEHGIPAEKVVRIAQCLPEDALVVRRRAQSRERPGIDRPLTCGFVGRLHAEKGIGVLLKAFDRLPDDAAIELWIVHAQLATPDWLDTVVTDRSTPRWLETVVDDPSRIRMQLARGRIKLFRPQASEEIFELMASVDVGIVPSLAFESPCLALLEFVAQRTPIVRSESDGMAHVTQDGINGRTFAAGDWRALRDVLLEIADEPALLDRWRARLPSIGNDADYARELIEVFTRVKATSASPARNPRLSASALAPPIARPAVHALDFFRDALGGAKVVDRLAARRNQVPVVKDDVAADRKLWV